jgi:HNH endonuclease
MPDFRSFRNSSKLPNEAFWEKVKKGSGCWLWQASFRRDGYGQFWISGRNNAAHRVSWFLTNEEWPKVCVLHRCDVKACVNPEHLFLGTKKDNTRDMDAKGRRNTSGAPKGSKHPLAKLTEAQVKAIRAEYAAGKTTHKKLAAKYGMGKSMIGYIVTNKFWTHI